MFGSHGHSHGSDGAGGHGHSHGPSAAHSHTPLLDVGFGDEEEKAKTTPPGHMMMMNPMMMNPMMARADADSSESPQVKPMMMMMPQMTPEMMEMAKKMFEQRQQLMREYMEKGGASNPAAMQEMISKAAQAQSGMMVQFKSLAQKEMKPEQTASTQDNSTLLNANINHSKLDELINKRGTAAKKVKEEEETKILSQIQKKDYSDLNAVRATQYGVLDRLKELVESAECDPNLPDSENVYLLHWAAINNRLDIAKYLLSLGCQIDPVGGELETSPLNWAARSGHVQMVVFLMQNGANPLLFDIEGFSTLHLATMFGHSIVVAYLLAKGVDADMPDKNGATPLMHAAQRVQSRDPAQLLITFNARLNAQDNKGNTPLHYCVAYNNPVVMQVLIDKGASLDVKNHKSMNPIDFAIDRKKYNAANMLQLNQNDDRRNLPPILSSIGQNKDVRRLMTRIYPFFLLFYLGMVFEASIGWFYKLLIIGFFYLITFVFKTLFFDKHILKYMPMATALAFIAWLYITWFLYFRPLVFDLSVYSLVFLVATHLSWYNLYKSYKTDPGVLTNNRDQMKNNEFSLDNFCTSCIIRKPLRSKHCAECDRCVAKFDHHCPWVDNCVGQNNLKYFVGFIFWTPICLAYFMHGAYTFYTNDLAAFPDMSNFRLAWQFVQYSSWVAFFSLIAAFNLFWIALLFLCHLYQTVFLALTTNERMNIARYKHFYDKDGKYRNPFHFGFLQNFVDLIDAKCCLFRPTLINWQKEHDIQDLLRQRLDKKKEQFNYQEV